ncbi:hypothetical protein HPB49_010127 [Dermacentor silvarum]|uniref:Uncharacterized protein n=1 Tax=Dermacentor silvarum TaxID=543639 RepID=A0ACB8DCG0_DERSI|nr:hypothetical protein HPB49_010127 [Dermacentor silvarum]
MSATLVKKHRQSSRHRRTLPGLSNNDAARLNGTSWARKAKVVGSAGPRSFYVRTENNTVLRRNRRHLLATKEPYEVGSSDDDDMTDNQTPFQGVASSTTAASPVAAQQSSPQPLRRSRRQTRQPEPVAATRTQDARTRPPHSCRRLWFNARIFARTRSPLIFTMTPYLTYFFVVVAVHLMLPVTRAVLMDYATFNAKVASSCFNESLAHSESAPAQTLDAFRSLVRKLEAAHPTLDVADTAAMLLTRFSIDFVDHQRLANGGERFLVDSARELKAAILEAMLRNAQPQQPFNEASLSEGEKCALFYMLSHTFNTGPPPRNGNTLLKKVINPERDAQTPCSVQEQGVVGVAHNATMSIALGHVLKGLVASKYAQRDTAENVLRTLKPYGHVDQGHAVVDHVYGPTVAGGCSLHLWDIEGAKG